MLHDFVVLMRVNADVRVVQETESHDVAENAMHIRITGNTVDDVIG
jgi:hypothetical protein